MAVIINDFEVVPAEPARQPNAAAGQTSSNPPPQSQQEVERVVEHKISRSERVWAH
ncbi:MAG: hypothetical protein QOF62_2406 [Pyrinomonadaceae bacterium]|jgi:hypothetical protein|nr:hypothetical protein [Pyrinomonadaceae bacterium]